MDPQDLIARLRVTDGRRRNRTPDCPDEHWIAAYVDGTLQPDEAQQLELHLADCDACIALVGLLSRERSATELAPVSETDLARARRLAKPAPEPWKRHAPWWAAAAMVLVSVPVLVHLSQLENGGSEPENAPAERVTRAVEPGHPPFEVLYPRAGMTVDPQRLSVRWTEIEGSDYYDVRIVSESGDLVVEQRVTETEWRPANPLILDPGAEYFVHVDAYPAEGKAVGSSHVPFRTPD